MGDGTSASAKFLPDIEKQLIKFTNRVIKVTMEQIVGPIAAQIESIPKLPSWSSATVGEALAGDLPTFSLTPQEYITKVGQYLVTFAHHLEPYMSSEDAGMCRALRSGSLPFIDAEEDAMGGESAEQAIRPWLRSAGAGVMSRYAEIALRIRQLSRSGAQQLAADIEYLCNVVEDLGLVPSENLLQLKALLLLKSEDLKTATGYPGPLLAAVREMRKTK